jgi:photosystem II stability/assembly factor-like uncharacterized protein
MKYLIKSTIVFYLLLLTNSPLFGQWVQQPFPTQEYLWKVQFLNDSTGWVLGDSALYKTTDSGESWIFQDSTTGLGGMFLSTKNVDTLFYSSAKFGINTLSPGIRMTINGGDSWVTVDSSLAYYNDLQFINKKMGLVPGIDKNKSPTLLKTLDGGLSWMKIFNDFSPSKYGPEKISFVDETHGWAVTYDAYIFKTTDGGNNWTLQDSIPPVPPLTEIPLRDIKFTTLDSGCVVGGWNGTTLTAYTTDGGENWNTVSWNGSSMREVTFLNSQIGWLVGATYPQFIYKTINGGKSWEPQTLDYFDPLDKDSGFESISMISENLGWAVGTRPGKLCKLSNPEITSVENRLELNKQIIAGYDLEQNYPNPFNPSTTISFQIPNKEFVTIKIFDVRGKEITTLHNKIIPAGKHKINFDASGLASGVYFYRMQAGSFKVYKKLLLIE